jgi:tetratricopeptide (TPR) repeat protein
MNELDDATHEQIKLFCAEGDSFASKKDYANAISCYSNAWDAIPSPKETWNASTWVLVALADCYFLAGAKEAALEAIQNAVQCPNAIGNPFIHLRYGQTLFDLGNYDLAAEELTRAYMGGGEEIFANDDVRYFQFLTTKITIK